MQYSKNKYLSTALISISVWLVANIVNSLLFCLVIMIAGSGDDAGFMGLVLLCSGLLSLPGLLIFWFVFLIRCYRRNVFSILLIASGILAFVSVLVFFIYLAVYFEADRGMWLMILPVAAAVGSTLVHRDAIREVMTLQIEIVQLKNNDAL